MRLSIGAPSSPFVSNAVMFCFDEKMTEYCNENNISYSRYADDLTFSTNQKGVLFELPTKVSDILNEQGYASLIINKDKTVYSSKAHNRHVTGITIDNNAQLSLGREKKRLISAKVHALKMGKLSKEQIEELKGHLAFAFYVEPKFQYRLEKKYGKINELYK